MDEKIVSDCAKKTFTLPANGSLKRNQKSPSADFEHDQPESP